MVAPVRIQLRRTAGWRMPENTVVVSRGPGRIWGNPYTVTEDGMDIATAVKCFRGWLRGDALFARDFPEQRAAMRAGLAAGELRGKNLACWCAPPEPGQPDNCHAAVLLELANS